MTSRSNLIAQGVLRPAVEEIRSRRGIHAGHLKNGGVYLYTPAEYHPCIPPDGMHLDGVEWQCHCCRVWVWSIPKTGRGFWIEDIRGANGE